MNELLTINFINMEIVLIIVLFLIWWVVGIAAYIYYITEFFDFDKEEVPFALFVGLFGLITVIAALPSFIKFKIKNNRILIKRRKS